MAILNVFSLSNAPQTDGGTVVLQPSTQGQTLEGHRIPFPPTELMQYGESASAHAFSGKRDFDIMYPALQNAGFQGGRVLDYSCSNGRVLRCFDLIERVDEAWGVDIDASRIAWCIKHFPDKFHFANITIQPHFPFSDGYFDLVYGHSIFTHLDDLHTAWVQECRRVVRIGGLVYFTFLNEDGLKKSIVSQTFIGKTAAADPRYRAFEADAGDVAYHYSGGILFTTMKKKYIDRLFRTFFQPVNAIEDAMVHQTGYIFRRIA